MSILQIIQTSINSGRHRATVNLRDDNGEYATETEFEFTLSQQDRERFRWYLEDYLQFPLDPAPAIAQSIEQRMAEIGTDLFKHVFQSSDRARKLWAILDTQLDDARVEISTGVKETTTIPWELLRDPTTGVPLALSVSAFVHVHSLVAKQPKLPIAERRPVRVLLVISRPAGGADVPFRSVAARLLKAVGADRNSPVHFDLLRPATFERLRDVLSRANSKGQPYQVVHFDGHGIYEDLHARFEGSPPKIMRGYLAFEHPHIPGTEEFIDGRVIGTALAAANVPILVLNACRSAYASPLATPNSVSGQNAHSQPHSLNSLAMEVINAGVAGVVAMRYNVYVVTAAQFVVNLYCALTQGETLGEAVSLGRKQLAANPLRMIAYSPIKLQDWSVPMVYEATPIKLFPMPNAVVPVCIDVCDSQPIPEQGEFSAQLPAHPDVGFYGRDETLLALDRAFDRQSVVLLHAYAGSGKTTTAVEFARWYTLTGGVDGPVLFTSFEYYKPLSRVLDVLGQFFDADLERSGVRWLALDDSQRRQVALDLLQKVAVLWVWDNVEPVAGFPTGTPSTWSVAEQMELVAFLREARDSKARFLLTSRREETGWLGDLAERIVVPLMPMQERVQLTRALAEKYNRQLSDMEDWRPLLEFTHGNPMTLTSVVGHALREGCRTKVQVVALVERLRAGELPFEDEATEGRAKSLGASLNYGFEKAFTEIERKQLALLHLFQGFVNTHVLMMMGGPEYDWCLSELRGISADEVASLLARATEVGLLTAITSHHYGIHPSLPWYFKKMYDINYSVHNVTFASSYTHPTAVRSFVESMAELGNLYHNLYIERHPTVIYSIEAEEANLLHAQRLARIHGWWKRVIHTMQGLRCLYRTTGRRKDWSRLVAEIIPEFVNPGDDGPLPMREIEWALVTEYRVQIFQEERKWTEAERIQHILIKWRRQQAAEVLLSSPPILNDEQKRLIDNLSIALLELAEIQREQGSSTCLHVNEEAFAISERFDRRNIQASIAYGLGSAYKDIPSIRDLAQADSWYRRSLDMRGGDQELSRARCLMQLGIVAYERYRESNSPQQPEMERRRHLDTALRFLTAALNRFPPNALPELAETHAKLGNIYSDAGDQGHGLQHLQESIRFFETASDFFNAAVSRSYVAVSLARAGHLEEAWEYSHAALSYFESLGERAKAEAESAREIVAIIEQERKSGL